MGPPEAARPAPPAEARASSPSGAAASGSTTETPPAPVPPAAAPTAASRPARSAPLEPPAQFTLDVLVYSEAPAERLVFINGRKYIEGQAVDGETVVEQITPNGAVLRHANRRLVLSPRLNPYARPGSP
jgi:hypothetical protein